MIRATAWLILPVLLVQLVSPSAGATGQSTAREPDVVYVPTPHLVVDFMLKGVELTSRDLLYDLGCGDGRIVIRAAEAYGARGVGIDIDPERIMQAEANARKAGVSDRVHFRLGDLFEAEIREASVVTLYLLPTLNMKLRPKLWKELPLGARVVSHGYDMGDWIADQILLVNEHPIYIWTITEETKRRANPGNDGGKR